MLCGTRGWPAAITVGFGAGGSRRDGDRGLAEPSDLRIAFRVVSDGQTTPRVSIWAAPACSGISVQPRRFFVSRMDCEALSCLVKAPIIFPRPIGQLEVVNVECDKCGRHGPSTDFGQTSIGLPHLMRG